MSVLAPNASRADVVPPPTEVPQTLPLDEALRIFRARGFDLLIAEAAVKSAEGDVKIAGAVPNPGVSTSLGYAFTYNPNDPSCMTGAAYCNTYVYTVGLSDSAALEDTLSGKRDLRLKVMRNALAAAKMAKVDARRNLEFLVKSAYLQVAQAELAFKFAKKVADSNVLTLDKFRARFASGAINEGDVARIRTQKLESDQAVAVASQTLRQARVALAFLLGVRGSVADFEVETRVLDFAPPASVTSTSEERLMRAAFDHRPDLAGAGYQRASARAGIELTERQRFPDIAFSLGFAGGGWGGLGTNASLQTPVVSVGLSGTLPVFYQLQGELRKAEAQHDTTSLQHAKLTAQVVNDVSLASVAERTSREMVQRMEGPDGLLQNARKAFEITALQFDKGAASLTDYLDAYRTFIATQVEEYQDLTNYWTAVFQLEQAVGMELR